MKTYAGEQTLAAFSSIVKTALAESGGGQSAPGGVPVGAVMIWPGAVDTIPSNWALCDGQDGRPDYRDIFLLGAGPNHAAGSTGGEETHTLTEGEMPSHRHPFNLPEYESSGSSSLFSLSKSTQKAAIFTRYTNLVGGGTPHNNMPPYKAVLFIIKIAPDPALDGVTMDMVYAAIAEAMAGAGGGVPAGTIVDWSGAADNIPDGWALCDGTNGTPDLRGKFTLGAGPSYEVGATGGEETHTLTVEEMPSHNHAERINTPASGGNTVNTGCNISAGLEYLPYGASVSGSAIDHYGVTINKVSSNKNYYVNYTDPAGGSQPHNNMPPYYVLAKIMKL